MRTTGSTSCGGARRIAIPSPENGQSAYLNWRYAEHATNRYRFFCLLRDGQLHGYIAFSTSRNSALVDDLFAIDMTQTADRLLLHFARRMRRERCATFFVVLRWQQSLRKPPHRARIHPARRRGSGVPGLRARSTAGNSSGPHRLTKLVSVRRRDGYLERFRACASAVAKIVGTDAICLPSPGLLVPSCVKTALQATVLPARLLLKL